MNKNKIIMAAIGGAAGLAAAGFGFLVYLESDARDEIQADLDGKIATINSAADAHESTAKAYRDNEKELVEWADAAYAYVESMDKPRIDPSQAPQAFKSQMFNRAQELMRLPADSETKIIKETFDFGERFKAYVAGDDIPSEAELPSLQRQWDDVMRITDILLEQGATELVSVSVKPKPAPAAPARGAKKKAVKARYPGSEETYVIEFKAKQAPLVGVLNAIATDERFMAVDLLRFEQAGDPLLAMIGGSDSEKQEKKQSRRRGRRSGEDEQAETEDEVARKGLVTRPEDCEPFTVAITVTTFDFSDNGEDRK